MSMLSSLFLKHGISFINGGMRSRGPIIADGGVFGAMGIGDIYFVDAANGSDNRNGKSPRNAFATPAYGYSKLTANQNDVLVLIGSPTTFAISDTLTWAKSYTHMVGVGAPGENCRARITVTGTDSATAGLVVSATGCLFENFRINNETSLAACGAVEVTGGRNHFSNVAIQGIIGALAKVSATAYSLKLNGAEENFFNNCSIGVDTVVRTNAQVLLVDGTSLRNHFKDCHFKSASETTAAVMVKLNDTNAVNRYLRFSGECLFSNFSVNKANTLASVISDPAGGATRDIYIGPACWMAGIDEWESNDRGNTWVPQITGAVATQGIGVEPAT